MARAGGPARRWLARAANCSAFAAPASPARWRALARRAIWGEPTTTCSSALRTLKWQAFDPSGPLQAFKTHSFDLLLSLSGVEVKVKTSHLKQWSRVGTWEPDLRYKPVGSATKDEARELIDAAEALLRIL